MQLSEQGEISMTDQERKAMEMALEALEWNTTHRDDDNAKRRDAIEALRQALAQPEQEPYCWVQSKLVQGTFYREKPRRIHTIPLFTTPVSKPKGIAQELRRLHQANQELVEALEWAYRYAIDNGDQEEYPFDWAIYGETLYQTLAKHKEQE